MILTITYRFDTQYRLVAWLTFNADFSKITEKGGRIIVEVSPGTLLGTERLSYDTPTEFNEAVAAWVSRLERELKAIPQSRIVAEHQAEIDRLAEQFDDLPDEYFSRAEAEELKRKLDELEERLSANIREHSDSKKDGDDKIAAVHRDIEVLKQRLDVLNKQGWVKTLLIRAAGWATDPNNRELLKSGADVAKSFLLPPGAGGTSA